MENPSDLGTPSGHCMPQASPPCTRTTPWHPESLPSERRAVLPVPAQVVPPVLRGSLASHRASLPESSEVPVAVLPCLPTATAGAASSPGSPVAQPGPQAPTASAVPQPSPEPAHVDSLRWSHSGWMGQGALAASAPLANGGAWTANAEPKPHHWHHAASASVWPYGPHGTQANPQLEEWHEWRQPCADRDPGVALAVAAPPSWGYYPSSLSHPYYAAYNNYAPYSSPWGPAYPGGLGLGGAGSASHPGPLRASHPSVGPFPLLAPLGDPSSKDPPHLTPTRTPSLSMQLARAAAGAFDAHGGIASAWGSHGGGAVAGTTMTPPAASWSYDYQRWAEVTVPRPLAVSAQNVALPVPVTQATPSTAPMFTQACTADNWAQGASEACKSIASASRGRKPSPSGTSESALQPLSSDTMQGAAGEPEIDLEALQHHHQSHKRMRPGDLKDFDESDQGRVLRLRVGVPIAAHVGFSGDGPLPPALTHTGSTTQPPTSQPPRSLNDDHDQREPQPEGFVPEPVLESDSDPDASSDPDEGHDLDSGSLAGLDSSAVDSDHHRDPATGSALYQVGPPVSVQGLRLLQCKFCSYQSVVRAQVRVHERTHTGEKPYKCGFCDFRSAQGGNIRIHERRHTGEKPYPCPYCSFASVTSSGTTFHVRSVHPDKDPKEIPRPPVRSHRRVAPVILLPAPTPEDPTARVWMPAPVPGVIILGAPSRVRSGVPASQLDVPVDAASSASGTGATGGCGPSSRNRAALPLAVTRRGDNSGDPQAANADPRLRSHGDDAHRPSHAQAQAGDLGSRSPPAASDLAVGVGVKSEVPTLKHSESESA